MKKNYKLLATLVLSGLAGGRFWRASSRGCRDGQICGRHRDVFDKNGVYKYKSVRKYVHEFYQRQYSNAVE